MQCEQVLKKSNHIPAAAHLGAAPALPSFHTTGNFKHIYVPVMQQTCVIWSEEPEPGPQTARTTDAMSSRLAALGAEHSPIPRLGGKILLWLRR